MRKSLSTFLYFFFGANLFCQNTTFLQGQVKQSNGFPLRNSAVLLMQYNPLTKTFSVVDSSYTDAEGKYRFDALQQYYLVAIPDESAENELPSYYGNSLFSKGASAVPLRFGELVTADFSTLKKPETGKTGTASLGGNILTASSSIAAGVRIFLADENKNVLGFIYSDSFGYFSFHNIPYGNYFLWADHPFTNNSSPDEVNVNLLNPKKDSLLFRIEERGVVWVDNAYTSISAALPYRHKVYSLQLNSLQHDVAEGSLFIGSDGMRMLKPQIGEFENLESLNIEINQIVLLPPEIGKLEKVTLLNASFNKLSLLPDEMKGMKNLKELYLNKNNFQTFPTVIIELPSLEILYFGNNPLTALPKEIGNLKNLKTLSLENCFDLLILPPQIGKLSELEILNLSNCVKLKTLPKEISNLKKLKVLDISGTKIPAVQIKALKKVVPGCEIKTGK